MPTPDSLKMTPPERRASTALAGLFACRMLGLFLLLPVFAVAAQSLHGGRDPARVGLALGMYGLTQAVMQIPFGLASDRWGRRPVVLCGLMLFVAGSVVCALSDDVFWVMIGRGVQGAGAISAAVTAWLADVTRPEVRTRAMAVIGGAIGVSFAASLVLAPLLVGWAGLTGLFWTIACLGLACIAVAAWVVPDAPRTHPARPARPFAVLTNGDLLRLNAGVFCLHLIQIALFIVMPGLLVRLGGLQAVDLWKVYLPVVLLSFVLMLPLVFITEKRRAHHHALRGTVLGLTLICLLLVPGSRSFLGLACTLTGFFVVFNMLEALQPSLVSRVAPPDLKGLALGFYNTAQALGLFAGGAAGGWLAAHAGANAVFLGTAVLAALWLTLTWSLRPLPPLASTVPTMTKTSHPRLV